MKPSPSKKKYKAIIFDVDGTLIPNIIDALPSAKVTESISKVRGKLHVGVATSRPLYLVNPIVKHLDLSGPSIVHGGAEIIDFTTRKIYFREFIRKNTLEKIYEITKDRKFSLYIDQEDSHTLISDNYLFKDSGGCVVMGLTDEDADWLIKKLSDLNQVIPHKIPSWEIGKVDVSATPLNASKQIGIQKVAEILKIKTDEIIGVGDGYNDFPLLMACGLKIAMGNAVNDLKEIADYIAPSVEEDGVVDIIEKFVV